MRNWNLQFYLSGVRSGHKMQAKGKVSLFTVPWLEGLSHDHCVQAAEKGPVCYAGLITKPTRGCQVSWVRFLTQGFLLSSLSPRVLSAKRGFRWSFQLLFVHLGLIEATGSRSPIRPRVRSLRSTQLHECKGSTWCAAWRSELGWIFRSWLQPGWGLLILQLRG